MWIKKERYERLMVRIEYLERIVTELEEESVFFTPPEKIDNGGGGGGAPMGYPRYLGYTLYQRDTNTSIKKAVELILDKLNQKIVQVKPPYNQSIILKERI
jgi:hypothetical protein